MRSIHHRGDELAPGDRSASPPVSGRSSVTRAQPDGDDRAATGELVERGDLARDLPRPAPWEWREHRARRTCEVRTAIADNGPRVDAVRRSTQHAVPAGLLCN